MEPDTRSGACVMDEASRLLTSMSLAIDPRAYGGLSSWGKLPGILS